ncbi:MAG: hypothetical protein LWX51_16080 [Deltaproteobacteria bacterium]|nr:hypothetical protein [Deltaproteobacteria bacterium]
MSRSIRILESPVWQKQFEKLGRYILGGMMDKTLLDCAALISANYLPLSMGIVKM